MDQTNLASPATAESNQSQSSKINIRQPPLNFKYIVTGLIVVLLLGVLGYFLITRLINLLPY